MKVIAINGSPKKNGNTAISLNLVGEELIKEGIDFEILHIGHKLIHGCIACGKCMEMKNDKCIFDNDPVNESFLKMKAADGILLGSPVYYANIAGTMKCFLDRIFYVAMANNSVFRGKVGASIVVNRRSGGSMTFSALNEFINYSEMVIPTSNYWNIIHGLMPGDVLNDAEGVQIMKVLGRNMAFLLKNLPKTFPPKEDKIFTNFVR